MPKAEYWGTSTGADLWNVCILGDATVPGVIQVSAQKGRDIEVKKSKGNNAATATDNGAENGTVTIETVIANRKAWEDWQTFLPKIDPNRPGATSQPLGISHPECAARGITAVYVSDVTGSPPTGGSGKKFVITCIEYAPKPKPPKKKSTTKQSGRTVRLGKSYVFGPPERQGKTSLAATDWDSVSTDNSSRPEKTLGKQLIGR